MTLDTAACTQIWLPPQGLHQPCNSIIHGTHLCEEKLLVSRCCIINSCCISSMQQHHTRVLLSSTPVSPGQESSSGHAAIDTLQVVKHVSLVYNGALYAAWQALPRRPVVGPMGAIAAAACRQQDPAGWQAPVPSPGSFQRIFRHQSQPYLAHMGRTCKQPEAPQQQQPVCACTHIWGSSLAVLVQRAAPPVVVTGGKRWAHLADRTPSCDQPGALAADLPQLRSPGVPTAAAHVTQESP